MTKARRRNRSSSKPALFQSIMEKIAAEESPLDKVFRTLFPRKSRTSRPSLSGKGSKARRQGFTLEALEPRLLLSADLTYGNPTSVPGSITDPGQINAYISGLTS